MKTKIGIIGLGIIGASILKGLFEKEKYEIFCVTNSSIEKAKKYTKHCSNSIELVKDCEIIFLCSRIDKTLATLEKLNEFLKKEQKVVEVCSIKKGLFEKKYNFELVHSHPMAGVSGFGFDRGFKELFLDNKWLLDKDLNYPKLEEIISDLGAKIQKINMKDHDKLCAKISHLCAIVSLLVFQNATDEAKNIASSGFRDTTRLAMTEASLLNSMFFDNFENLENEFLNLQKLFENLKKMSDDERIELFKELSSKRKEMYDENGKNIFKI